MSRNTGLCQCGGPDGDGQCDLSTAHLAPQAAYHPDHKSRVSDRKAKRKKLGPLQEPRVALGFSAKRWRRDLHDARLSYAETCADLEARRELRAERLADPFLDHDEKEDAYRVAQNADYAKVARAKSEIAGLIREGARRLGGPVPFPRPGADDSEAHKTDGISMTRHLSVITSWLGDQWEEPRRLTKRDREVLATAPREARVRAKDGKGPTRRKRAKPLASPDQHFGNPTLRRRLLATRALAEAGPRQRPALKALEPKQRDVDGLCTEIRRAHAVHEQHGDLASARTRGHGLATLRATLNGSYTTVIETKFPFTTAEAADYIEQVAA